MITIRPEQPADIPAVRQINEQAFGQPAEAAIVDAVRAACPDAVSLVAVDGDVVVGHILFSPACIQTPRGAVWGMGLAPMAVRLGRQRQGIGSMLVRAGIKEMGERGCPFVIVLGHPEFYPQFGFVPASRHGLACQWEGVPDDVFKVLVLDPFALAGVSGVARYRDEFDRAM